jgi:hypothetical protein
MTPQVELSVVCRVLAGHVEPLHALLDSMGRRPADNEVVPFGRLAAVHFARVLLLDEAAAPAGEPFPTQLVLMADVDGPLEERLTELVDAAGDGLDRLFGHCEGYPAGDRVDRDERLAFLRAHHVRSDAYYTNTIGRTVEQIHREELLRQAIEDYLETRRDWCDLPATQVRSAIQDFVGRDEPLAWVRTTAAGRDLACQLREVLWLGLVPLLALVVALALLPALLLVGAVYVAILRWQEVHEPVSTETPSAAHVRALTALEDHGPQNQFSVVGVVKPSRFRRLTLRAVLFLTDYGARHLFNHANLAGVKTIHFARWTPIDGRRRMVFASNYDGSLESYMDDFIDKVWWGLNATFSSGQGYPRTEFLLFGGSRDELAFKRILRLRQVPTQVWYSAYPHLTALNIETNSRIRAGLHGRMGAAGAARWLALL